MDLNILALKIYDEFAYKITCVDTFLRDYDEDGFPEQDLLVVTVDDVTLSTITVELGKNNVFRISYYIQGFVKCRNLTETFLEEEYVVGDNFSKHVDKYISVLKTTSEICTFVVSYMNQNGHTYCLNDWEY